MLTLTGILRRAFMVLQLCHSHSAFIFGGGPQRHHLKIHLLEIGSPYVAAS